MPRGSQSALHTKETVYQDRMCRWFLRGALVTHDKIAVETMRKLFLQLFFYARTGVGITEYR